VEGEACSKVGLVPLWEKAGLIGFVADLFGFG
jgi:hypothetical protein